MTGKNKDQPAIKDANDLLKMWTAAGVEHAEQCARVKEILAAAPTMAETAAQWAGKKKGADRDQAMQTAFRLIGTMDKVQRAQYRSKLAEAMGLGIREFNDILKAASGGEEEGSKEIVETLGGWI